LSSKLTSLRTIWPEAGTGTVIFSSTSPACGAGSFMGCSALASATTVSRGHETFPVADRQVDRCQGARRSHRAGDDRARSQLTDDREIGAEAEHCRLKQHAQDPRDRGKGAADVIGPG